MLCRLSYLRLKSNINPINNPLFLGDFAAQRHHIRKCKGLRENRSKSKHIISVPCGNHDFPLFDAVADCPRHARLRTAGPLAEGRGLLLHKRSVSRSPLPVSRLSMDAELHEFLAEHDMESFEPLLKDQNVTSMEVFVSLRPSHLQQLGLKVGDRVRFDSAIKKANKGKKRARQEEDDDGDG